MTDKFEKEQDSLESIEKPEINTPLEDSSVLKEYMRTHRQSDEDESNAASHSQDTHQEQSPTGGEPSELNSNSNDTYVVGEKEQENETTPAFSQEDAVDASSQHAVKKTEEVIVGQSEVSQDIEDVTKQENEVMEPQSEPNSDQSFDDPKLLPLEEESELRDSEAIENGTTQPETSTYPGLSSHGKSSQRKYLGVLVLLVAVIGGVIFSQYKKQGDEKAAAQRAENLIASYYTDKDQVFPKTEKITAGLTPVKSAIEKVKNQKNIHTKLSEQLKKLEEKTKQEEEVNALYTNAVITDDTYTPGNLKADQEIKVKKLATDDKFGKTINDAIEEAEKQYTQLQHAKKQVKIIYADNKVVANVTREQYKSAQTEVEKIKNPNLQASLVQELKIVDESIMKQEEKVQEEQTKQALEEQQRQEVADQQQAVQTAQDNTTSTQTNPTIPMNGTSPGSIMNPNQAQIDDSNNVAWLWNSGIQEKVIGTCIQRGYIVEGGYVLQRNSIIDGEGYYDLYATNLNSSLMKGYKPDQLPVYLVTINCKTGWFKGRGPN